MSTEVIYLDAKEARKFFLKPTSYFTLPLPPYFDLGKILSRAKTSMGKKELGDRFYIKQPTNPKKSINYSEFLDINYTFQYNKTSDSYRPITLIHPYLYVDLVNCITKEENWEIITRRFKELQSVTAPYILCKSLPFDTKNSKSTKKEQKLTFWKEIEQESIKLSLEYKYLTKLDISNFYGSIYTHTIPWALYGEDKAKEDRNNKQLLGNILDHKFQHMNYNETVSIPQGNVISDLIAELILAYIDSLLIERLNELEELNNFKILRYRDDYWIFTHNSEDSSRIKKELITALQRHKLSLGENKTEKSSDIVRSSLKKDKLYWLQMNPVVKLGSDNLYKKSKNFLKRALVKDRKKYISDSKFNKIFSRRITSDRLYAVTVSEHLLLVKMLADEFPNSGQLIGALQDFEKRIQFFSFEDFKRVGAQIDVVIAIVVDIIKSNPKITEVGVKLLSVLLMKINYKLTFDEVIEAFDKEKMILEDYEKRSIFLDKIYKKISDKNYNSYLEIWIQRLGIKNLAKDNYLFSTEDTQVSNELSLLCLSVIRDTDISPIFNQDWLKDEHKIDERELINIEKIEKLQDIVTDEEIELAGYALL